MKERKVYFLYLFFVLFIFVFGPLSIYVGGRGFDIGTDTENYYIAYSRFLSSGHVSHEPGIYLFALFSKLFSGGAFLFFSSIFLFHIFIYTFIYSKYFSERLSKSEFLVYFAFYWGAILISSWFETATINVIRHGIALALLYLSLVHLSSGNLFLTIAFYSSSVLFHLSNAVFLPFFILFFMKERWVNLLYLVSAIFFPLGISESIIRIGSEFSKIPIYQIILEATEGTNLYVGFNLSFYLYTIFWFFLSHFVLRYFCRNDRKSLLKGAIKAYTILSMVYFIFGFAALSTRFAFFAWLFIPLLQTVLLVSLNLPNKFKAYLSAALLLLGIVNYYLIFDSL